MLNVVRGESQDSALEGNILAAGAFTGAFGFEKNEENAARFTFLGAAADDFTVL